jgi:hypothetical protein
MGIPDGAVKLLFVGYTTGLDLKSRKSFRLTQFLDDDE